MCRNCQKILKNIAVGTEMVMTLKLSNIHHSGNPLHDNDWKKYFPCAHKNKNDTNCVSLIIGLLYIMNVFYKVRLLASISISKHLDAFKMQCIVNIWRSLNPLGTWFTLTVYLSTQSSLSSNWLYSTNKRQPFTS
jgi:hypothetical protein